MATRRQTTGGARPTPESLAPPRINAGSPLWWLPAQMRGMAKDAFFYTADFDGPIAASGTTSVNISINGDSDFVILAGSRVVTAADNLTVTAFPAMLVTLTDASSGRQLMDRAVHMENLFGTAQLPKLWEVPKVLSRNTVLTVKIQNLDPANTRIARVTFHGFKVFDFAA